MQFVHMQFVHSVADQECNSKGSDPNFDFSDFKFDI